MLGNGTKLLDFKKSKTLCPYKSVTMQIWFRKSKQSRRWMQRFWLCLSFDANVESTRSSIREASRYLGTERMTLIAHSVFFLRSQAWTTLPKVPWPRSFMIWSARKHQYCSRHVSCGASSSCTYIDPSDLHQGLQDSGHLHRRPSDPSYVISALS